MANFSKRLLPLALTLCALMASTATAATINISPGGSITAASLGKFTFSSGAITIRCNWTLSGSLATSASAAVGARMGSVSRVEVASCEGGTFRSIENLPWELTFLRLLVNESGVTTGIEFNIRNLSYTLSVTIFGIVLDCAYSGTLPVLVRINAGVTELIRVLANSLSKTAGGGFCPETNSMTGTFGITRQTITLS